MRLKGIASGEASVLMKNIKLLNAGVFKPKIRTRSKMSSSDVRADLDYKENICRT